MAVKLAENEQMMAEMSKSWEDKLKEAQDAKVNLYEKGNRLKHVWQ